MTASRSEFHNSWVNVVGWGRTVTVRSRSDLQTVHTFIADSGDFRRAVMLQNVTKSERRELVAAIEGFGVELTEFAKTDKKRLEQQSSGVKEALVMWGVFALSLPYRIVLLLQRRKSVMLVLTTASGSSRPGTATPGV